MRRKTVEKLEPVKTKKMGLSATVQIKDEILILNIYKDKVLHGRYCMNTGTCEYESWYAKDSVWTKQKLCSLCGYEPLYGGAYDTKKKLKFNSEEEKAEIGRILAKKRTGYTEAVSMIDHLEDEYNREKRWNAEERRRARVKAVMDQIPELPEGIEDWIWEKAAGRKDFAFYEKEEDCWYGTCCGHSFRESTIKRSDGGKKIRHNDMVICPECSKVIQAKKRAKKCEQKEHFMILQTVNEKLSVARHFDVDMYWKKGKRQIEIYESIRITLNKLKWHPKYACDIYYNQYGPGWGFEDFDNKGNKGNRRTYAGYLYEAGIEEALKDTAYESWTRNFLQLAAGGRKLQYNMLMCTQKDADLQNMVECLHKGRFFQLLRETSEYISYWTCQYWGPLKKSGKNIEEVFEIQDRQKINRIRDMDGGYRMLEWMKWSERNRQKVNDKTLRWLLQNNLDVREMGWTKGRFSMEQAMNYIERQRRESYKGKSAKSVIGQYEDYMYMCKKLHKDTTDEMVYRPRELKRRHDEAVAAIERMNAQLKADEYSKRFKEAEQVLGTIKEKFEYTGEKFFIRVPERIVDIVSEGNYLHHCAGATDRYFDRIKSNETYICFLRKTEEPEIPFYTIEVEPGGTIRQHRGMYDEEPEIEKVKPFLKEWQKEIRKRMSKKDYELEAVSKQKRRENIAELKEKNNIRVLNGLMEDFMEAM